MLHQTSVIQSGLYLLRTMQQALIEALALFGRPALIGNQNLDINKGMALVPGLSKEGRSSCLAPGSPQRCSVLPDIEVRTTMHP